MQVVVRYRGEERYLAVPEARCTQLGHLPQQCCCRMHHSSGTRRIADPVEQLQVLRLRSLIAHPWRYCRCTRSRRRRRRTDATLSVERHHRSHTADRRHRPAVDMVVVGRSVEQRK